MKKSERIIEKGNILFLILIAVALFAALSYAITSSSRSGGGDASSENALISSAQVVQYPVSVHTAVMRMVVGGLGASELLFNPPSDFASLNTPELQRRGVFHPAGGAATRVTAPPEVMANAVPGQWIFSSNYIINGVGTTGVTNDSNDIVAFLPGITQALCQKINAKLGIPLTSDIDGDGVPNGTVSFGNRPTATDEMSVTSSGIGPWGFPSKFISEAFEGHAYGCVDFHQGLDRPDDQDMIYYHVLIER